MVKGDEGDVEKQKETIESKIISSEIQSVDNSKIDDQIIFTPKINEESAVAIEKKDDHNVTAVNTEKIDEVAVEVLKPERTRTRKPRIYENTQTTRVIPPFD